MAGVLLGHTASATDDASEEIEPTSFVIVPLGFITAGWQAVKVEDSDEGGVLIRLTVVGDDAGALLSLPLPYALTYLGARSLLELNAVRKHIVDRVLPIQERLEMQPLEIDSIISTLVSYGVVRMVDVSDPDQALKELADCWVVPFAMPRAKITEDDAATSFVEGIPILAAENTIGFGMLEIPGIDSDILDMALGQKVGALHKRAKLAKLPSETLLGVLLRFIRYGIFALLPAARKEA